MQKMFLAAAALCVLIGAVGCEDGETGRDGGGGQEAGLDASPGDQSLGDSGGEGIASCLNPGEVKVLFLVDTSGGIQLTDPGGATAPLRQRLVEALIAQHQDQVSFGIFTFNAKVENQLQSGLFTRHQDALAQALVATATAELTSDLEGPLHAAQAALAAEMAGLEQFERSSTRYVVVLLTDGGPNPICTEGCDNDGEVGPGLPSICDTSRDQWCESYGHDAGSEQCQQMLEWYPGLEACAAYNGWPQIQAQAEALAALEEAEGLGALDFYVVSLLVAELSQVVREAEEAQLQALATAGGGSYVPPMVTALDLSAFDFSSLACLDD